MFLAIIGIYVIIHSYDQHFHYILLFVRSEGSVFSIVGKFWMEWLLLNPHQLVFQLYAAREHMFNT